MTLCLQRPQLLPRAGFQGGKVGRRRPPRTWLTAARGKVGRPTPAARRSLVAAAAGANSPRGRWRHCPGRRPHGVLTLVPSVPLRPVQSEFHGAGPEAYAGHCGLGCLDQPPVGVGPRQRWTREGPSPRAARIRSTYGRLLKSRDRGVASSAPQTGAPCHPASHTCRTAARHGAAIQRARLIVLPPIGSGSVIYPC